MLKTFVALALLGACFAMPMNTTSYNVTEAPIDCSLFRPNAVDANRYYVLSQSEMLGRSCGHALVWDQELCRCVNPPVEDMDCPAKRPVSSDPRLYEEQVWGVWQEMSCFENMLWNQTACRCDWDPEGPGAVVRGPDFVFPSHMRSCQIMFNATFDNAIVEDSANYYIQHEPYGSISIDNVPGSVGGGAARLDSGKMTIWALAGNTFSNAFQIKLSFKVDDVQSTSAPYVTLFTNDCDYDETSVYVKYQPAANTYTAFLRDSNSSVTLDNCVAPQNELDFHTVSLEYQENILVLRVDGENVCSSADLSGEPPITQCPLRLGGDYTDSHKLQGYLDEVVIRRNCVVQS